MKNLIISTLIFRVFSSCVALIISFSFFVSCQNDHVTNLQDVGVKTQDSVINSESWLVLLDTTIEGIRYSIKSPNDSINNSLFFFYNNKSFQLDANKLGFKNGVSNWYFEFPVNACVYDSKNLTFKYEKLIIKPNYYLFAISDNGGMFESICILFRDSLEVKKCFILPNHQSNLVSFNDSSENMLWGSYFDIDNEILVTEERIAYYNTGPYLVSVIKIEKDTIIHVGEIINNHENYYRYKDGNNIFERMMKEHAENIISNDVLLH